MPIYKKFYQIDPNAFLPFNDSPTYMAGSVAAGARDELIIRGESRYQLQDWYNIGGRTPYLSPHSFAVSVTAIPKAAVGAYTLGVVGKKRPSINVSHFLRSSVCLGVEKMGVNFFSGFAFDNSSNSYDDRTGRSQYGVSAPFSSQDEHYTLSAGYDADKCLLWCSFNGIPLHEISAKLGTFRLEVCLEAVGIAGKFDVTFENMYYRVFDLENVDNLLALNAWDSQYAPVFVSYSHRDKNRVDALVQKLRSKGVRVMGDWDFGLGDSLLSHISASVSRSAYLLVALSKESVASSWVKKELEIAMNAELNGERDLKVLPVLIDDCDIPLFLRGTLHADLREESETRYQSIIKTLRKWGKW